MRWNERLRLVFSDVDETVADLYRPAEKVMVDALTRLLEAGVRLVLITGQSVANVEARVVMGLSERLRHRVAVGACSGAELWGYAPGGGRNGAAFYTLEAALDGDQRAAWREIVGQLLGEFQLTAHPAMPVPEFRALHGDDPRHVMLEDRGPQITIEFPNPAQPDLRIPVSERARELLEARSVPVTPRLAGIFALDFALAGVSKTRAVEAALAPAVLEALGLGPDTPGAEEIEIWGDRFSKQAGTDWLMCAALDHRVRAISFRDEDPAEFPEGYNIQLWDGTRRLQSGLLEFLQQRVSPAQPVP